MTIQPSSKFNFKFLAIGLVAGILLGLIVSFLYVKSFGAQESNKNHIQTDTNPLNKVYYSLNDSDPVYRSLIDNVNVDNLRNTVRFLAGEPHLAGTDRDNELADYYVKQFKDYGMDRVLKLPYRVLLSYPDEEKENSVYIIDENSRRILHTAKATESKLRPEDKTVPAFNAYAPKGDVSGTIVYANYGSEQDFDALDEIGIDVKGQICLIRLGKMHRGNKAINAGKAGCSGVLFFSDPEKIAPFDTITADKVYPNSLYMNGEAMQRGSARTSKGDPLTPGYPAIDNDGVYRLGTDNPNLGLARIPCQPIGYNDARIIFENMYGPDVTQSEKFRSWKGALNCTYRLSTDNNRLFRMVINNKLETRIIYNVLGILDGDVEPDRYVIVGNHRDSYGVGAMDAVSGGAPMLESARVFGELKKKMNWRPRRSLIFASWSGEEYGLIGSFEFVEQHLKVLQSNSLTYINIDTCVKGADVDIESWPSLQNVCRETFKRVPAHKRNSKQVLTPTQTIYNNWAQQLKDEKIIDEKTNVMPVKLLGSGSDHAPFAFYANIPSVDFTFKPVNGTLGASYPAYHTAYETLYLLEKFVDPDYEISRSCSRVISMFLYQLSGQAIFGTDFRELSQTVQQKYEKENLKKTIETAVSPANADAALKMLEDSMNRFANQTAFWHLFLDRMMANETLLSDAYRVRFVNDVSSQVHRVFTSESYGPGKWKSQLRNILFAPPAANSYSVVLFPAIVDLINEIQRLEKRKTSSDTHEEIDKLSSEQELLKTDIFMQINKVSFAFDSASRLLSERQL